MVMQKFVVIWWVNIDWVRLYRMQVIIIMILVVVGLWKLIWLLCWCSLVNISSGMLYMVSSSNSLGIFWVVDYLVRLLCVWFRWQCGLFGFLWYIGRCSIVLLKWLIFILISGWLKNVLQVICRCLIWVLVEELLLLCFICIILCCSLVRCICLCRLGMVNVSVLVIVSSVSSIDSCVCLVC